MKNKIMFIALIITHFANPINAKWYEFDCTGKVLAISKISQVGKISVFIISTPWCGPCKILKNDLKNNKNIDMQLVDIYYVNMADNYNRLQNSKAYEIWRKIEGLDAWPYVYITAPTTNIVSNFSPIKEQRPYERILNVISALEDETRSFKNDIIMTQIPVHQNLEHEEEQSDSFCANNSSRSNNPPGKISSDNKEHSKEALKGGLYYENNLMGVNAPENKVDVNQKDQPMPINNYFDCWFHNKGTRLYNEKGQPVFKLEFSIPYDKISLEQTGGPQNIIYIKIHHSYSVIDIRKLIEERLPQSCFFAVLPDTGDAEYSTLQFFIKSPRKERIIAEQREENSKQSVYIYFND